MLSTKAKLLSLSARLPSQHLTVAGAHEDYMHMTTVSRCDCFIALHLYAIFSFIITQMRLSFVKKKITYLLIF